MSLLFNHASRDIDWRVYVADDDDDTRVLMASALRRAGLDVVEASNGRELLAGVREETARRVLVISDVGMPELDGIAVASAVRDSSPSIPVLLVTAFGDSQTLKHAKAAGASLVLSKPINFRSLVTTALELMRGAS